MLQLLKDPRQQAVIALTAGIWLGISAELSVVLQHATNVWGATPAEIGLLLGCGSTFGMLGGLAGGWLADRYGRRAVLIPSMGVAAISTATLTVAPSLPVFFGAFSIWATSLSVVLPTLQALAVDITAPDKVGQAQGMHRQGADLVWLLCPMGLGLAVDMQGGSCTGSIGLTAVGMVGALAVFRSRLPPPPK